MLHLCLDEVVFEDRGKVAVKGVAEPIRMFLVEGGGGDGASKRVDVAVPTCTWDLEVTERASFGS